MRIDSDFLPALNQLAAEKGIGQEVIIQAIESALVSAYKRNFGNSVSNNVVVRLDRQTGEVSVFSQRTVVEEARDPKSEVTIDEVREVRSDLTVGDIFEEEITPPNFGRIAAQTAKQVVLQRIREAERELVYKEFEDREGDIVTGVVQRVDPKAITIDLGKAEATMPASEQVPNEHYRSGQRIKVYVVEVNNTPKGPQIVVSRTHRNLVRRLFEMEVPEIFNGTVEIKAIAREPGSRSKVAVAARQEGVDPVGSCVGLRGVRNQNIVSELSGEKIDVIEWHPDPAIFVAKALSPAQVLRVDLDEEQKTASVWVPERQLSLAIGREGQNARLAARLTGWRIDIKPATIEAGEFQTEPSRLD